MASPFNVLSLELLLCVGVEVGVGDVAGETAEVRQDVLLVNWTTRILDVPPTLFSES
jgi:hypothetical protein